MQKWVNYADPHHCIMSDALICAVSGELMLRRGEVSTNIRNFSIRFQGPKFFNSLSPEIQNSESIRLFGKRLKKFLLS